MTIDQQPVAPGDAERVAGVLDIIRHRADLDGLRVLDLACRNGAFTSALAAAGADALGLEGRAENLAMAWPDSGARFEQADVRELSADRFGTFDVTLCLGLLYHLDAVDAVALLRAMREVTTRFAVIDTHVSGGHDVTSVDDRTYRGHWYGEPEGWWSSIGNPRSWWFTPESLDDAVINAGWSTVEHLSGVRWTGEPQGRRWLVIS
jgi:SAM-dependent methyltransferase